MNIYSLIFLIIVAFNCFINVYAENSYYVCAVLRKEKDDYYDEETEKVQNKIDKLVNERMNDIYTIIKENKHTYTLKNGKMDKKLEELESSSNEKRSLGNKKFLFVNEKRSTNQFRSQNLYKRSVSSSDDDDLIPLNSELVGHVCPIKNYYAIRVYLSDAIIEKVESLPNIKYCEKSFELENVSHSNPDEQVTESVKDSNETNDSNDSNSNSNTYYDLKYIQKETNWTSVGIQEIDRNSSHKHMLSYLPLISQSRYFEENTKEFDYNYYYPKSGGQGIDIFIIDSGIDTKYDEFDTYEGTDHERVVMCDGRFSSNWKMLSKTERDRKFCEFKKYRDPEDIGYLHGHAVAAAAGGKYVGTAKYANIHMLATSYRLEDELNALDYVKSKGEPHKTVINISRGGSFDDDNSFKDKFEELTEYGFIIVVSAANDNKNCCSENELFTGFNTTIKVAATEGINVSGNDLKNIYMRAFYSNYGACVDVYAPGQTLYPMDNGVYELYGNKYDLNFGTSFASPLTAGVIATLMSEHPEIKYTNESMRKLLHDLSLKNVIKGIQSDDTPNRFLNNGKKIVYSPVNTYEGCGASSGYSKCPKGSCCTSTNQCLEIGKHNIIDHCLIEKGCQPEFGTCLSEKHFTPVEITSTLYIKTKTGTKQLPTSIKSSTTTSTTTTTTTSTKTIPTNIQPKKIYECGVIDGKNYGNCTVINPQNTAYISLGCCNKDGRCGLTSDYCSVNAGCQNKYGMCLIDKETPVSSATADENSKIGQKCGKGHGSCIIKGEDGHTYEHISCCSEKGYCGLSDDHCGKGCQSEFGACYSHHNIPVESSSGITITLTTDPISITSIESESTPITESIPITTESIPITTESTTTHTKTSRTKSIPTTESTHSKSKSSTKSTRSKSTTLTESTPITESTFTTSYVKSTKSTTYITKTTTITIS